MSGLRPQPFCRHVLRERYLQPGETGVQDVFRRVARALASVEAEDTRADWERRFLRNLRAGAIGAGRIMRAAGTPLEATLVNCFVQPLADLPRGTDGEGRPGIGDALAEAATTLRLGGGVGIDFSPVRPQDAGPWPDGTPASGPCRAIDRFEQVSAALQATGARRSAQMGVLRIDHPDVLAFAEAKRTPGRWPHFNVSVGVTDAFMQALDDDRPWALVHRAPPAAALHGSGAQRRDDGLWVYRHLPARALWATVMRAAHEVSEPGVLFLDTLQRDDNLRAQETLTATNPCGEQPLPPHGACVLGPLILPRFVRHPFGIGGAPAFDEEAFARAVAWQVRALDNVLDLTRWPLPRQREEALSTRRIGVGFTGLGDALVMCGLRYDRPEGRAMASRMAVRMRDAACAASVALAREKGPFPRFDAAAHLAEGTCASRLPASLREAIRAHGIRNSHLLSIAPTGTVSLAFADNTSPGIEPAYAWNVRRRHRGADGVLADHPVQDHAWRRYRALGGDVSRLPPWFVDARAIAPADHLAMVAAVQPCIDAGISKTVPVPEAATWQDVAALFHQAWRARLKGLTVHRPGSPLGAVLRADAAPA